MKKSATKVLERVLLIGTPFTSLFLTTASVTDPVNAPKLLICAGVACSSFFIVLRFGLEQLWNEFRVITFVSLSFVVTCLWAVVNSDAPFAQNYYGAYGRNTGFLTYLMMTLLMLSALQLKDFSIVVKGLIFTGIVNVIYSLWVVFFGDFIPWTNIYGNILGLFGNPDFISAFLGMFVVCLVAIVPSSDFKIVWRFSSIGLALISLYLIKKSHAIQGLVVAASGLAIIVFFLLHHRYKIKWITTAYTVFVLALGFIAVLGTLQKGPMNFLYKRSVSLRGSYWHAGLEMGSSNPFTGVGLDTYGDWYRRTRPPVALVDMPGINTMSNVAHNVVIDFFASGGWPLLLSYGAILVVGALSIFKGIKLVSKYDPIFVALSGSWVCYQLQSFISINQIGLTVWGWVLTGSLIGYVKNLGSIDSKSDLNKSNTKKKVLSENTPIFTPQLAAGIGIVVGLFFGAPAINADSTWKKALESKDLTKVEKALNPTFMNPAGSYKYAQAVDLFVRSNLPDQAHKYASIAVKFNPDFFDAWSQLYSLSNSTQTEKLLALQNMKRLDPLNPDVTAR